VIPITRPELPPLEEYRALLEQIWSSRMLSNFASFALGLERLATEYLGVETKVVVSGDIGLALAISCFDLPASGTCLVPSFTFNSTVSAVLWNRLRPVFVDIDPETLTLDVAHTAALAREHRPSLIIATHVFGNPADVDGLSAVAASTGRSKSTTACRPKGLAESSVSGPITFAEITCGPGGATSAMPRSSVSRGQSPSPPPREASCRRGTRSS